MEVERVGIFGGSFDPVHQGHIHLARLAKEAARLDEVWFMPCAISPHKSERPPSDGEKRVEWLKVALRGLDWAQICEVELAMEGPSFSYRTMKVLIDNFPEHEWFWIMGGDQWDALPGWRNVEVLAKQVVFVVLARGGVEVMQREGYRMIRVEGEHPASSTLIREALAKGERGIEFLNPEVELAML